MASAWIPCLLLVLINTVQCKLARSNNEEDWTKTRSHCSLANASNLCDDTPGTCNLKNDIVPTEGRFWIDAYVQATTFVLYAGCKTMPAESSTVVSVPNITLKDCIEICNKERQKDERTTLGLYRNNCYCTAGVFKSNDEKSQATKCSIPCSGNTNESCGGEDGKNVPYMSTYKFHKVRPTQMSGQLSWDPLCQFWNKSVLQFDNCIHKKLAVCQDNKVSPSPMTWTRASKWCQDKGSILLGIGDNSTEHWLNLIKHRFVQWPEGDISESITYCVSLFCKEGHCSFESLNCTRTLHGLCWNPSNSNDNKIVLAQSQTTTPMSTVVTVASVYQSDDSSSNGKLDSNDNKIVLVQSQTTTPMSTVVTVASVYQSDDSSSNGKLGDIMTGATCGAGDAHSSGTSDLTFGFCEVYTLVAVAGIVLFIAIIIVIFFVFRKRRGATKDKSKNSAIEETARPLMEHELPSKPEPNNSDELESGYTRIASIVPSEELEESKPRTSMDPEQNLYSTPEHKRNDDDDSGYTRIASFAQQPEVENEEHKPEPNEEGYDILRTNKRPEGSVDSTYDHIPGSPDDDVYNVLKSEEDLKQEDIGDFMYDVTSAIDELGKYDSFNNKPDKSTGDYDTLESVESNM